MSESRSEDEWQEADLSSTSDETCCFIEQLPPEISAIVKMSEDEWQEADVSSRFDETCCFIEQLPPEVMEMIFPHVPHAVKLRAVCKRWCAILSRDQTVCFRGTVPHDLLENCPFEKLGLKLRKMDINEMPPSVWEKIGFRVHSVELHSCVLGDYQGLKNLIIHCQNLRSSRVVLGINTNKEDIFCLLSMLKELNIIRRNLETFKFSNKGKITIYTEEWIQIFEALFKVFPNVTRFIFGSYHMELEKPFTGEFRKTDMAKLTYSAVSYEGRMTTALRILPDFGSAFQILIRELHFFKRVIITVHPTKQTISLYTIIKWQNLKKKKPSKRQIKEAKMLRDIVLHGLKAYHC